MTQEIFNWIWIILLFVMIVIRKFHEKKAGRPISLKGTPIFEVILMMIWGLAAGILPLFFIFSDWLAFADYPFKMHWILKFISVSIFMLSIWLLHHSHIDLGKMWSLTVEPKKKSDLVATGVYKRIRHPMYTAHLLWGIAQLLFFPNYIAGPLALLLFYAIIRLRVPREEKALIKEFGDEYNRYTKQTGCIFPKISN